MPESNPHEPHCPWFKWNGKELPGFAKCPPCDPPAPPRPRKPPLSFREAWSNVFDGVDCELTRWAFVILVIWGMSSAYGWITAPDRCPPAAACEYMDRSDRYDPFSRDFR